MDFAIISIDYSGKILCEIEPNDIIVTLKIDRPPYKIKRIIETSMVYEEDWDIRDNCYIEKKTHMANTLIPNGSIILLDTDEETALKEFKKNS